VIDWTRYKRLSLNQNDITSEKKGRTLSMRARASRKLNQGRGVTRIGKRLFKPHYDSVGPEHCWYRDSWNGCRIVVVCLAQRKKIRITKVKVNHGVFISAGGRQFPQAGSRSPGGKK